MLYQKNKVKFPIIWLFISLIFMIIGFVMAINYGSLKSVLYIGVATIIIGFISFISFIIWGIIYNRNRRKKKKR
jgi:predicted tellurium resistance membrane protein TerC